MSTIVTRSGKGSPLTHTEVDDNFNNLNTDKYQEGSAIGAVTPAAGTFTTLTATGQTSLGGAAGSESLRVLTPSATGAWADVQSVTSNAVHVSANAASGNIDLVFNSRASGSFRFRTAGSLEQFRVANTASAVNYVQVTGAATGNKVRVASAGSEASVGMTFDSKGSGSFAFTTNANANPNFSIFPQDSPINYLQVRGTSTGIAAQMSSLGSDTNVAMALVSKGTGAIDLAAGSSGVNISNGGTVTAITRTNAGSNYSGIPSVVISTPTTAGGVQATATVTMQITLAVIASGGTGYTVGDILTVVGGTGTAIQLQVSTVSAGVVTGLVAYNNGAYSVLPTNPVSVTGGTGSGATFNITYGITGSFTITNAGSGYVEQPTVSFSGGGGSGAAAYASVGSSVTVKSIHGSIAFTGPQNTLLNIADTGNTAQCYMNLQGSNSNTLNYANGSASNVGIYSISKGTGQHSFTTNGSSTTEQFRVSHTTSAVNYVQVTGAATSSAPIISAQGSDANAPLVIRSKGTGVLYLETQTGSDVRIQPRGVRSFSVNGVSSGVNYGYVTGSIAGGAPIFGVEGTDTNIDLILTPKGTGNVRFGTLTTSADAPITGYITIKDSGGTVRKLAVIA